MVSYVGALVEALRAWVQWGWSGVFIFVGYRNQYPISNQYLKQFIHKRGEVTVTYRLFAGRRLVNIGILVSPTRATRDHMRNARAI